MKWAFLLALIATDITTKLALDTPRWGWHEFNSTKVFMCVTILLALIPLIVWSISRFGASIIFAGGALNLAWIAFNGSVANPFVLGETAFNLADVMLFIGVAIVEFESFKYLLRLWRTPVRMVH